MPKQFFDHLNQFISISEAEFEEIVPFFKLKNVNKKQAILEAGTTCTQIHFVLNGCLNMFFITDRGTERTVQFAIENWWLTDFLAFQNKSITEFNIQAVEASRLLSISRDKLEELLLKFPKLEKYFRTIYQIGYGASLVKMKYLLDFSKEDIYFLFTEQFPEFAQRVPQKLIASYLGLTPEYVSEIRAKRRS